jgi:hypothetical protein
LEAHVKSVFAAAVLSVFGATTSYALPGVPDGDYSGQGSMHTTDGPAMAYAAKLSLSGNQMVAFYDYGNGHTVTYTAELAFTSSSEFDLKEGDQTIGAGYCDGGMCHLDVPAHRAEETIFVSDGGMKRIGSMLHGTTKLIYSETLAIEPNENLATVRDDDVVMLECTGPFDHSETERVEVIRSEDHVTLVESMQSDGPVSRVLTAAEVDAQEYRISPIYGIDRVIKKVGGAWKLVYSCGEIHDLSCTELN